MARSQESRGARWGREARWSATMRERIAIAAYFRAEHRNFEAGHEMDDWLTAEKEILGEENQSMAESESLKGLPA